MSLKGDINSSFDLYQKLKVEAGRLEVEVTDVDYHNFIITASNLFEWIQKDLNSTREMRRKASTAGELYHTCKDIANAMKHFNEKPTLHIQDVSSMGGYGMGRYGAGAYGVGERSINLSYTSGNTESILDFKNKIMDFFRDVFE